MFAVSTGSLCSQPGAGIKSSSRSSTPAQAGRPAVLPAAPLAKVAAHRQQGSARQSVCLRAAGSDVAQHAPGASSAGAPVLPYRIGHGFDLHRLEPGFPLIIGGVDIPHERGCDAHSDGDVLLHCVVDAILGALSLPDIGQLFSDKDPRWKGANSDIFLKEAVRRMKEAGYVIGNIDSTLIAERPKLSPFKEQIRDNLCALLEAHPSCVNVKAKTHEKVDSLGENRSIACHTVVILIRSETTLF